MANPFLCSHAWPHLFIYAFIVWYNRVRVSTSSENMHYTFIHIFTSHISHLNVVLLYSYHIIHIHATENKHFRLFECIFPVNGKFASIKVIYEFWIWNECLCLLCCLCHKIQFSTCLKFIANLLKIEMESSNYRVARLKVFQNIWI